MRGKLIPLTTLTLIVYVALCIQACIGNNNDSKTPSILVVLPTTSNKYWQEVSDGAAEAALKLKGKCNVIVKSGGEDADARSQLNILRDYLGVLKIDAIVIGPADSTAPISILSEYVKKGTKLIVIDSELDQMALNKHSVNINYQLVSDNEGGGAAAAKVLIEKLGPGPNTVILLQGNPVHMSAVQRENGFRNAANGEWKIVPLRGDWVLDTARSAVSDYIVNNDVDGIFAASDEMAMGAIAALENKYDSNNWPIIIGFDATTEGLAAVSREKMYATIKQDSRRMGYDGVMTAYDVVIRNSNEVGRKTIIDVFPIFR